MKKPLLSLLYLLGILPAILPAQINLSTQKPVAGEPLTISLAEPDTLLVIAYRPNSSVVRRDTLRAAAPTDVFEWTPARAGVVALSTSNSSRNVSVRFRTFSWRGLIVMLLAGAILFGGVVFAFRVLFREAKSGQSIDTDPTTRPDT